MNLEVPPQNSFFYKGKWTHTLDKMLLATLIHRSTGRSWAGALVPESVILEAGALIARDFGLAMKPAELKLRVEFLKARYKTFKEVVATRGTHWDFDLHIVVADVEVWKLICKRNPLASAYYHRGEPEFNSLATVFGLTDVKKEEEDEVIILSDSSPIAKPGPHLLENSPTVTEEVNSPVVPVTKGVRRKLFTNDTSHMDRQSSTAAPVFYLVPCADGSFKFEVENHPPCRSIPPRKPPPNSSPAGSSQASWSPFPTSRKSAP